MFKRFIEPVIQQALGFMPIVLLRGARQTGKTTLAKALCAENKEYTYLTFDHLPTLAAAKNDPVGFIAQIKKPVVLDEIQRVPELFLPIKADVDEHRCAGRYLLAGSADPLLIPKLGDSLAGRMRLLTLWPLSQGELIDNKETFIDRVFNREAMPIGTSIDCSKTDIFNRVVKGGYPAPIGMALEQQRREWFNDYMALVLQKDITDLAKIENINVIPNLLMLLASRSGGLLNNEELARTTKLSSMTLRRYIDLLRTLFLIHLVPAWSDNLVKRLVKSPKIYLSDTALQLYALNIDQARLASEPYVAGSVIENFVVLELFKQLSWTEKSIQLFHYRDYKQEEVDVILEGPGGDIVAIEIKSNQTVSADDFKHLKSLKQEIGGKFIHGFVLYTGATYLPFSQDMTAAPIAAVWS